MKDPLLPDNPIVDIFAIDHLGAPSNNRHDVVGVVRIGHHISHNARLVAAERIASRMNVHRAGAIGLQHLHDRLVSVPPGKSAIIIDLEHFRIRMVFGHFLLVTRFVESFMVWIESVLKHAMVHHVFERLRRPAAFAAIIEVVWIIGSVGAVDQFLARQVQVVDVLLVGVGRFDGGSRRKCPTRRTTALVFNRVKLNGLAPV